AATLPQRRTRRRKRGEESRLTVARPFRLPLRPCWVDRDRVGPARYPRRDLPLRPELLHLEEEETALAHLSALGNERHLEQREARLRDVDLERSARELARKGDHRDVPGQPLLVGRVHLELRPDQRPRLGEVLPLDGV